MAHLILENGSDHFVFGDTGKISDGYHTFDELYDHRHLLFLCLLSQIGGWKSKFHSDGTMFDDFFIAGTELKGKIITYHIPIKYWNLCQAKELDNAPEWDGHTSNDVLDRLRMFLTYA